MTSPIGIVAGSGSLPWELAEKLSQRGQNSCVAAMEDFAVAPKNCAVTYKTFPMGKVGAILDFFRSQGCKKLVFLGPVKRVSLKSLAVDQLGRSMLLRLGGAWLKGDDGLLRSIIRLVEEEGFEVVGAHEVLPELNKSTATKSLSDLNQTQATDIALGFKFLESVSSFDIGQACVVCEGRILALEGPEGTDEMLKRAAKMSLLDYKGVLVKTAKKGQDLRIDMPTIGSRTAQLVVDLGFSGIAIEEGKVLLAHPEEIETILCRGDHFLYTHHVDKEGKKHG